eukprot:1160629-Pelagomonas_calceolata.AAC.8
MAPMSTLALFDVDGTLSVARKVWVWPEGKHAHAISSSFMEGMLLLISLSDLSPSPINHLHSSPFPPCRKPCLTCWSSSKN